MNSTEHAPEEYPANALQIHEPVPRFVVCAAIRDRSKKFIICGARHYDGFMRNQINATSAILWAGAEQGFIDNKQNFLTREEALTVALQAGQIRRRCGGDHKQLFSENLY